MDHVVDLTPNTSKGNLWLAYLVIGYETEQTSIQLEQIIQITPYL